MSDAVVAPYYYPPKYFSREIKKVKTDSEGRYEFTAETRGSYEVRVSAVVCTYAESVKFAVTAGETYQVEDLVVRRAGNSCKGRIVFEDGSPAANLPYGYLSRSFSPTDDLNPPKTNERGEFTIENLLPDESFFFWLFPAENTLCVRRSLDPNSKNLKFTLAKHEYIDLPEDWCLYGTHRAIVRQTTTAKDSAIRFSLPDLDGNLISLADERFKNKAVLVNITGSWCGGCRLETPYLVDFQKKYGEQGLEIVGIAFERGSPEEQLKIVKRTSERFKLNYPLLVGGPRGDKSKVEAVIDGLQGFQGYPTTLYIDRSGTVRHIQAGFWISSEPHKKWQLKQMEDHITALLEH